jgi:hypothetical protein
MGKQIIKQPDGLYAVFSGVSDTIVLRNATVDELVEVFCEESRRQVEGMIRQTVADLDGGGRPYFQFTMTWEEALEKDSKTRRKR